MATERYAPRKNQTLQGMRGLAVLLVFVSHVYSGVNAAGWWPGSFEFDGFMLALGAVGVHIFFLLSGYLAVMSLKGSRSFSHFMLKRVVRLYPVFLLLHLSVFVFGPVMHSPDWMTTISLGQWIVCFGANMLLLPGVFDLPIAQPVTWAMSYIFYFYVLVGLLYWSLKKTANNRSWWLGVFLATGLFAVFFWQHPRSVYFAAGMAVYALAPLLKRYSNEGLARVSWPPLLVLSLYGYAFGNQFLALPATVIFFAAVVMLSFADGGLLNHGAFAGLGNISYSMYLSHPFIMTPASRVWPAFGVMPDDCWIGVALFSVVTFSLCLLVSMFLYRWVETVFTDRCLKRYLR